MLPIDDKAESANQPVNTGWRGRLTPVFAGSCASALLAGGIVAIGAFVTPSDDIRAASINSSASVTIEGSSSGIISVSNFEVGIAPTATEATETDVTADDAAEEEDAVSTFLREQINQTSQISPARFTVFGQPNQVFAVTVPSTVVSSGGEGESVTFSDFSHDAGVTPVTGGSGSAVFAVGAAAQVSLEVTPVGEASAPTGGGGAGADSGVSGLSGDLSGDTGEAGSVSGTETADASGVESADGATDDTPPKRSNDPFGFKPNDEKFLNVLVSYN